MLRTFCAVYDVLGARHALIDHLFGGEIGLKQADSQLNYYLMVMEYRYTLYLKLLVSVQDRPKRTWPLPPWYIVNSV
jgi:hypothetical protein